MADDTPNGERGSVFVPQMRLDELLSELQVRINAVMLVRDRVRSLLDAVVSIGSGLDLESTLRRIVSTAMDLVDARYGAMGVIGPGGELEQFIPLGMSDEEIAAVEHWPEGRGLLGILIKEPKTLRLSCISEHPESAGFPPGHPPMRTFLGVPIRVRNEVFGNLYLTEKRNNAVFDEEDEAIVTALATAAGIAIENARLYEETRRRETWLDASDEITTRLLSGTAPREVLHLVAKKARHMADADLVAIATPDRDEEELVVRIADGPDASVVRGRSTPVEGSLTGRAFRGADPIITELARESATSPTLLHGLDIGPVVLVPFGAPDSRRGVLILGNVPDASFPMPTVQMLHAFAGHAAVTLSWLRRAATRNGSSSWKTATVSQGPARCGDPTAVCDRDVADELGAADRRRHGGAADPAGCRRPRRHDPPDPLHDLRVAAQHGRGPGLLRSRISTWSWCRHRVAGLLPGCG